MKGRMAFAVVLLLGTAVIAANEAVSRDLPSSAVTVERPRSASDLLREDVPSVEIRHVLPAGTRLMFVRVQNEDGLFEDADPSVLQVVEAYSLSIRDGNGTHVLLGDERIRSGDIFVRALLHNPLDSAVWVYFDGDRHMTMGPGDNLFLGDNAFLEPTHKLVCRCRCEISGVDGCSVTLPSTEGCSGHNGDACMCAGDDGNEGTLKNCHLVWVPVEELTA